ncbi:Gfo/Idh/MocA family oxidoreductase [Methyloceanibacter sp.]|uniref:Gfo/Idh/MocA family protein n=1 Tax=Methyloceanibacter sp. TaxID=1965321 RepID=UPI00208869D9|nr:Gfo/Idh/MocA family oxidoreductase [Methyloceanibacter sp.]GFO80486.1 MAG: UDP-N-acetylglucosamine 3-dehydrogenase [Methyloceanibacter sp.]HML92794.1 Gfo/Idh/MocA family oxidoreductase [Methyloceanibacter sp.]
MADQIRTAVVGTGYFGRFHANHYTKNPDAKLVAVVDSDPERAKAMAEEFGCEAVTDHRDIYGKVDAASVAVPTPFHFDVARDLVDAGIHVNIEKPITETVEQAQIITKLAEERGTVLQVGHIERYSAAYRVISEKIDRPLYLESYRIAPWKARGVDVDVILDLMIHDIDMIIGLVGSPVSSVDAVGTGVMGRKIDIANARINFESGCVANVTSSRISYKTERRLRVFSHSQYLNCDLGERKIFGYSLRGDPTTEGLGAIATDTVDIPQEDSLGNEIASFLDCVKNGKKPFVDGYAGSEALRVAVMINESIDAQLKKVQAWLVPGEPVRVPSKS